jgi:plastocyanin
MKKTLLSFLLFSFIQVTGFSTVHKIQNVGTSFSPETITITAGDTVEFDIETSHNAVEVSKSTWDANGSTALSGGFSVAKGGGSVLPAKLAEGTHYYVCQPHASMGMKGTIIVKGANSIAENAAAHPITLFPSPATDLITIKGSNTSHSAYSIISIDGKEVLSGKLNASQTVISIQGLAPGVYFFMAEGTEKKAFTVIAP